MSEEQPTILPYELQSWDLMLKLLRMLKKDKGEDRSERARKLAITITELEKLMAYYNVTVMQERDFAKEIDELLQG